MCIGIPEAARKTQRRILRDNVEFGFCCYQEGWDISAIPRRRREHGVIPTETEGYRDPDTVVVFLPSGTVELFPGPP